MSATLYGRSSREAHGGNNVDDGIEFYETADIAIEKKGRYYCVSSVMGELKFLTEQEVAATLMALAGALKDNLKPHTAYLTVDRPDNQFGKKMVIGFKGLDPAPFLDPKGDVGPAGDRILFDAYLKGSYAREDYFNQQPAHT